eukprot:128497_1
MGALSSTDDDDTLQVINKSKWINGEDQAFCMIKTCHNKFTLTQRRHHCRFCGIVVCNSCSSTKVNKNRICDRCYDNSTRNIINISSHKIHMYKDNKEQLKYDKQEFDDFVKDNITKEIDLFIQQTASQLELSGYLIDINGNVLWAELNGTILKFYKNQNQSTIVNATTDVIDLRMFINLEECKIAHPTIPFGMRLIYRNTNQHLLYCFQEETERNKWFNAISQKIEKNEDKKSVSESENKINDRLIISCWSLQSNNNIDFIQLTNDGKLIVNNIVEQIDQYSKIKVINKENNFGYKYGVKLINEDKEKETETDSKTLYFKQNNLRLEWFAHLDFCLLNNITEKKEEKKDETVKESKNINLKSVLQIYESYMLNEQKTSTLIDHLANSLNVRRNNVMQHIIGLYHKELISNQKIEDEIKCKLNENECPFIHTKHEEKNMTNETRTDFLPKDVLDKSHEIFYHKNITSTTQRNSKFIIETLQYDEKEEKQQEMKEHQQTIGHFGFGTEFL